MNLENKGGHESRRQVTRGCDSITTVPGGLGSIILLLAGRYKLASPTVGLHTKPILFPHYYIQFKIYCLLL